MIRWNLLDKTKHKCRKCGGNLWKQPARNNFYCRRCETQYRLPADKYNDITIIDHIKKNLGTVADIQFKNDN